MEKVPFEEKIGLSKESNMRRRLINRSKSNNIFKKIIIHDRHINLTNKIDDFKFSKT